VGKNTAVAKSTADTDEVMGGQDIRLQLFNVGFSINSLYNNAQYIKLT
jgi:hypothetical protein